MRATRNRIARLEDAAARAVPRPRLVVVEEDGELWTAASWEDLERRRVDPAELAGYEVTFVQIVDYGYEVPHAIS